MLVLKDSHLLLEITDAVDQMGGLERGGVGFGKGQLLFKRMEGLLESLELGV